MDQIISLKKIILPFLVFLVMFMNILGKQNVAVNFLILIQSTLVISKSKGPSESLRDIRTSTYQICRTEENTKSNNQISLMSM